MNSMPRNAAAKANVEDDVIHLDEQLCFALYATSRAITGLYRPVLHEIGLTYPQYLVMLVLWEHRTVTVTELGERLHLDSGTLTPLLKRLEKQGLIVRSRDRVDERQVNIEPTLAGARMRRKVGTVALSLKCKLPLPEQKVRALRTELKQLLQMARGGESA
jgi:MarR family transcriptional regulator, organic hydroperoxide resistance regulator